MSQRAKIYFDIEALEKRIKNTPVDDRFFNLFTSKEIVAYFLEHLTFKVRELSETFPTLEERTYFGDVIGREHLWDELRRKVLIKLFENSIDIWLKLKDGDLITVMYKFFDESLVYQSIDELSDWIKLVYKKIAPQ